MVPASKKQTSITAINRFFKYDPFLSGVIVEIRIVYEVHNYPQYDELYHIRAG
jgi:hypothetical protein